jgi:RHS repeat-associated protein
VSYRYDVYGSVLSVRTEPVVVVSAQFAGWDVDDSVWRALPEAGFVRRSYEFLDGFGRPLESHVVAPDGSGKRLVTQTYDELGRAFRVSEPYWDDAVAQAASGVKAGAWVPDLEADPAITVGEVIPRYSETVFDASGRVQSTSLVVAADGVQSVKPLTSIAYALDAVTTTQETTGASTVVETDVLGRTVKQTQCAPTGCAGEPDIVTQYQYQVTASGSIVTVIDDAQRPTVFESDLGGRRTKLTDPNSGVSTYTYNPAGQVEEIVSATGTVTLTYDDLGRMTDRTSKDLANVDSSEAHWEYDPTGHKGALDFESATTVTGVSSVGALTTLTEHEYDQWHRPKKSTVTLPAHAVLGGLSGQSYETTFEYDETGQPTATGYPSAGGLPSEFAVTDFNRLGAAKTLTLTDAITSPSVSTSVVEGVDVSATGQLLSRSYGNGVTRSYGWDALRQLESLSASFDTDDAGPLPAVFVQNDVFERDDAGRIIRSENRVVDAITGEVSAECFVYDGFNRLAAAWTVGGESSPDACGTAAPANSADVSWDGSDTRYARAWTYSSAGRILTAVQGASGYVATSTYAYTDADTDTTGPDVAAASAATSVETVTPEHEVAASDAFTSGDYAGDDETDARWVGSWVEADDAGSPAHSTGRVDVDAGVLRFTAAPSAGTQPSLSRVVDTAGVIDGELQLTLTGWSDSTTADDRLVVEVTAAGAASPVTEQFAGGDGLPAGTGSSPETVSLDLDTLLASEPDEVTVTLKVISTVDEALAPAPVFLIDEVTLDLTVGESTATDEFNYDAAGRMTQRTVNGVVTDLTWDGSSNLTSTTADGVTTVYAYDASGQRVAQAVVADADTTGKATAYVASSELTDANTDELSTGDVTGTRFYTFGGATVAVRNSAGGFWLLFGDEQGSAQIMMPATIGAGGVLEPATGADAANVQRTAYEPYGARRGEDLTDVNRGWLGQVEDAGTGLTYLNARYYDPMLGRFLSPDPLMDPGDPRTLDPYRYADNNPIVYSDATGLRPDCSGLSGDALRGCRDGYKGTTGTYDPSPRPKSKNQGGWTGASGADPLQTAETIQNLFDQGYLVTQPNGTMTCGSWDCVNGYNGALVRNYKFCSATVISSCWDRAIETQRTCADDDLYCETVGETVISLGGNYIIVAAYGVLAGSAARRSTLGANSSREFVMNLESRTAARQALTGEAGVAANRFFRGATSKSQDFQIIYLPNGGYRFQYFSPAKNPGYGKVYIQEVDDAGIVMREYKNTVGPDGIIETKWVHGAP